MPFSFPRRRFMLASGAGLAGQFCVGSNLTSGLPTATAGVLMPDDIKLNPNMVSFRPEIEPIVQWIEKTPRDKIIEVAMGKLQNGLPYRDFVAGIFLAGIRNIKPRPVGFKFHAVMVIQSAHALGQWSPLKEAVVPMLWALDNFKDSQERDLREGDWSLGPVEESRLPKSWQAKEAFRTAMDAWDAAGTDVAVAAMCRSHGSAEVMEEFWRYAIRDQQNIGHKAIFTAHAWRTLEVIGWQHAEPVLRSLAFGLLDRQGRPGTDVVGPYQTSLELARQFPKSWRTGSVEPKVSLTVLDELRDASAEASAKNVLQQINAGVDPRMIWDGILLACNELLLRKPGIIALHAVTSANALHYIYQAALDEETRKLAMVQAAGWVGMFRASLGDASKFNLNQLAHAATTNDPASTLQDILKTLGTDRQQAAQKTMAYLQAGQSPASIFDAARKLVFAKGDDSHDFKFAVAAWEEASQASSPQVRALLTAAMMGHLPPGGSPDNPLMAKIRAAL